MLLRRTKRQQGVGVSISRCGPGTTVTRAWLCGDAASARDRVAKRRQRSGARHSTGWIIVSIQLEGGADDCHV